MENLTLNDKVRKMRETGKSHDYIMGYLDCILETLEEQREEIVKDIKKGQRIFKNIKTSEPSWLNEALNEGDGVYRP